MGELFSATEVATITGLSRRRIVQYARRYDVPRLGGFSFIFEQHHVDDILARMRPETKQRIRERRGKGES